MSFILHGVNEQSCSLDSKFLLELRLIVYHKLFRHGLFCYFSRAKWLGYEAAVLACRLVMTAQRGVETGGVFVLFSCCMVFKLSEYCDILRLQMKQAWARDSPVCSDSGTGWMIDELWFDSCLAQEITVFSKAPRPIHLVDKAAEAS